MGSSDSSSGTTSVDPTALRIAAGHLENAAAAMLSALGGPLGELRFTGSAAGRDHADSGAGVRAALDGLVADTARWAHAVQDLADALTTCALRYGAHEEQACAALR